MNHAHPNILVALAGQPNCGKSTIFNLLTGARQHVANFPGVTVEKKQGVYKDGERKVEVVDLPGTYSLTSYTQEERVARDFLLLERPEAVVSVIDASNLERHLYLLFQLREMRVPMVLCLNMIDVAERRSIIIDTEALSNELGIPVVATNGKSGRGGAELRAAIRKLADTHAHDPGQWRINYGELLEPILASLTEKLEARPHLMEDFPPRWLAVKLLENDGEARRIVQHHTHDDGAEDILQYAAERRRILREENKKTPEKVIATARYKRAAEIVRTCVIRPEQMSRTLTDRVDAVVLHRIWAPVILALVLFVFYQIAMIFGTAASDWAFPYLEMIKAWAQYALASPDPIRAGLFESLVVDGLVHGILSILYYIPLFLVLFSMLAILEDTGYMARVAFILDRLLRWFGLHGQSTLPMILGGVVAGGCAVPGVLATRAMKDEKARLVTILIMPLMNCGAKLPFYALMVGLMISPTAGVHLGGRMILGYQGLAVFALSVFSFLVALLVAKLFSHTLVKGEAAPFVMELPVYHLPTVDGVLRRALERVWLFVKKIITVVAVIQVCIWFCVTFPGIGLERELDYDREHQAVQAVILSQIESASTPQEVARAQQDYALAIQSLRVARKREQIDSSFAGVVGKGIEPLSKLAGFEWRMNIAILASFAAKESLVGTLGTIYSVEEESGASLAASVARVESNWTIWHKLAILVFVAMFPPCLATIIVIQNETASWGWAAFATVYPIMLGFMLAVAVFQGGPLVFG